MQQTNTKFNFKAEIIVLLWRNYDIYKPIKSTNQFQVANGVTLQKSEGKNQKSEIKTPNLNL